MLRAAGDPSVPMNCWHAMGAGGTPNHASSINDSRVEKTYASSCNCYVPGVAFGRCDGAGFRAPVCKQGGAGGCVTRDRPHRHLRRLYAQRDVQAALRSVAAVSRNGAMGQVAALLGG